MVYYYKSMRWLLHPVILSSELSDSHFLRKCADACSGVCQTYKRLHQLVHSAFEQLRTKCVDRQGTRAQQAVG